MSDGSYELIARLGRGGMGVVDLARAVDGSRVALKRLTLHGSGSDIARARERLLREADVLRRLHHPNIVGLIDVIDEGDEIVLVMPYLAGGSLADRVAQHGPAPAAEVERQARRLLGALATAHAGGIVHRDIKPANILFNEHGEPCLADFGVALSRDHTQGLTLTGMVVGTPSFMAPEQARGEPVSPASDVFSLGATLLFAATGEAPYGQGDPGLLMVRAASGKVEKVPRRLPPSLRSLLRPMLDPRPERRPAAAALAGGGPAGTLAHPLTGSPRRARAAMALAGVAVVAAVVGAALWARADGRGAPTAGELPVGETPVDGGCEDLAYQPCGDDPAPFTDGETCVDDHADYDGVAANGCEAAPDDVDGAPLDDRIVGTIVPADDVDRYPMTVVDELQLFCDGTLTVELETPRGMRLRLEVRADHGVAGTAVAEPGEPARVELTEQRCGADDGGEYEVVVRAVGSDRVADDYVLTRTGSF